MIPLALLCFTLGFPSLPPTPAAPPARKVPQETSAFDQLRRWMAGRRPARRHVGAGHVDELRSLLTRCRLERVDGPAGPLELDLLVDLASMGWSSHRDPHSTNGRGVLTQLALEELERETRKDPAVSGYLAGRFLEQPPATHLGALVVCELFAGRYLKNTATALVSAAMSEDLVLRDLARQALVGWDDDAVHRLFLNEMDRGRADSRQVARHFASLENTPDWIAERLRGILGRLYLSADWRDAARAGHLVETLDAKRSVPILIEALALWDRRTKAGDGSKRIRHEIVTALRDISGRSMGARVDRWNLWWNAVLEGRIALSSEREAEGAPPTRATFFGLRPVTDKVAFVVDRSGSMETYFGTSGRTRYDEACEQTLRFIEESGADTRFSVTLFNNRGERWRPNLVPASKANLRQARSWLSHKEPSRGTGLFKGLATALRLGRKGTLNPRKTDVDTVILLCDGETDEGPDWVAEWMRKFNGAGQLVFHCIQIGRGGDGTLNDLARLSGGQFLRVGG